MKIGFFRKELHPAGGIETWLYYIAKRYQDLDVTVYYETGDAAQLARLRKLVKVVKHTGQSVKLDKAFHCFDTFALSDVKAKENILVVHADYSQVSMEPVVDKRIKKIYAVSDVAADSYEFITGKEIETLYNPVELDKPQRVLKLVSATRLSEEKGWERMQNLIEYLDLAGVEYEWQVFTPNKKKGFKHPNVVFREPKMNVLDYVAGADYLVQLSDTESYCYSLVEALMLGVPVITTKLPVLSELGITSEHGVIIDLWDMDYSKYINDIVDREYSFKYTPPADNYDEILKA